MNDCRGNQNAEADGGVPQAVVEEVFGSNGYLKPVKCFQRIVLGGDGIVKVNESLKGVGISFLNADAPRWYACFPDDPERLAPVGDLQLSEDDLKSGNVCIIAAMIVGDPDVSEDLVFCGMDIHRGEPKIFNFGGGKGANFSNIAARAGDRFGIGIGEDDEVPKKIFQFYVFKGESGFLEVDAV